MSSSDEPDSPPALCGSTAAILQQFLARRAVAEEHAANDPFQENWALSQFWYTDDTAAAIAAEAVRLAAGGRIACLACPSLFRRLRTHFPEQSAHLLEYDSRFEVLGDFTLYDYNEPLAVPEALHHAFEVVVADPPYLAEECLEKTAQTMRLLSRRPEGDPRFLLLTGSVQRDAAQRLLGVWPAAFRPQHSHKLGNEFYLYASVQPSEVLGGWDAEFESGM